MNTKKILLEIDAEAYSKVKEYAKLDKRTVKATFEIMVEEIANKLPAMKLSKLKGV